MASVLSTTPGTWTTAAHWTPEGVPGIGADVEVPAGHDLTVDDDTAAVGSFTQAATATVTIANTKTLDCDGPCILADAVDGPGTLAIGGAGADVITLGADTVFGADLQLLLNGTNTITNNATALVGCDTVINTAGTITLATDFPCIDFTRTLGAIAGAYTIIASGNVFGDTGTGSPNITMTGTGGKTFDWANQAGLVSVLTIAEDAVIDIPAGTAFVSAAVFEAGSTFAGTGQLRINTPGASNWWSQAEDAVVDCELYFYKAVGNDPGGNVVLQPGNDLFITDNGQPADTTEYNDLCAAGCDIFILGTGAGDWVKIQVNGEFLAKDVEIGSGTTTGSGTLALMGTWRVDSFKAGHLSNTANALSLNSSYGECAGAMNMQYITLSGDATIPAGIWFDAGGILSNVDDKGLTNPIAVWGDASVLGAGCTDTNIADYVNAQTPRGALMTMGIGGGAIAVPF